MFWSEIVRVNLTRNVNRVSGVRMSETEIIQERVEPVFFLNNEVEQDGGTIWTRMKSVRRSQK